MLPGVLYGPGSVIRYEWAGVPHNSATTQYVDDEAFATNLVPDPSFEGTLGSVAATNLVIGTTTDSSRVRSGVRALQLTATSATDPYSNAYQTVPIGNSGGKWLAFRVSDFQTVGFTGGAFLSIGLHVNGAWQYTPLGEFFTAPVVDAIRVVPIPEGLTGTNARVMVYPRRAGQARLQAGDRVTTDAWMTSVADTEQLARRQVEQYFDGSTPDVQPAASGPVRELRSVVMIDGVERDHDEWQVHRELSGDLPAQVVSRSGLMQATGAIAFADETVRNNARNPFNRTTGWIPRRGQEVRIYVEHRGQMFQRFQGVIDSVRGAVGGGLDAKIIDGHDRFSAEVNHEALLRIMPPLVEGEPRRGVGLTAMYYVDLASRAAGYFCTPPRERNASLTVNGQTSLWPEAGTLQSTVPVDGQSHATNKSAPWGFALGSFEVSYSPWGNYTSSDPLQLTMTVAPEHAGGAFMEVRFASGSRHVRLTISWQRVAILSVAGATVASLPLGDATVVSALVKNGRVTLRANTGSTATGSTSLSGGSLRVVQVRADSDSAIAGLQVSHPDTGSAEFASTNWVPNARIDSGSVALYEGIGAGPRIVSRKAGNVLDEITSATLTAAWIDETGLLQIVPSDVLQAKAPVTTINTADDVLSLDWEDSVLQSPARVTVTAQKPIVHTSIYRNVVVWEGSRKELAAGETHEEFVEPSTNEEWVLVQENLSEVGLFSASSMGMVNRNRHTVGGGYYAVEGDWQAAAQPDGFTVTMDRLGINKYLIKHQVHSAPADSVLVCGVPKDHPGVWDSREGDSLPRINAFGSVQWTDEQVSAVTVSGPGPELTHDAGPWAARPDSTDTIEAIANFIAGQTAYPQPVIRGLEIFPDPRLQLADMIEMHSDVLLGVRLKALIVGVSESMSRTSGLTQTLDVRIKNVTTTAETYEGWDKAIISGQLTYSAFNNLPVSPQSYEAFNRP